MSVIRPRPENFTWWKVAVVLLSMAVFVFCLTQTAVVTPGEREAITTSRGTTFGELLPVNNSSINFLKLGWLAVPVFLMYWTAPIAFIFSLRFLKSVWKEPWAALQASVLCIAMATISIAVALSFGIKEFKPAFGLGSWLANPCIVLTWLLFLFGSKRSARAAAVVALALMLSFLFVDRLPFGAKDEMVPIQKYAVGYWTWILSAAIMVAASFPFSIARAGVPVSSDP